MRRGDSWAEIGILALWIVSAVLFIGFIYVAIHFIYKFW